MIKVYWKLHLFNYKINLNWNTVRAILIYPFSSLLQWWLFYHEVWGKELKHICETNKKCIVQYFQVCLIYKVVWKVWNCGVWYVGDHLTSFRQPTKYHSNNQNSFVKMHPLLLWKALQQPLSWCFVCAHDMTHFTCTSHNNIRMKKHVIDLRLE